jgi:tripartite-type tricarboxylate transporter receptor subunit TctC
MFANLSAVMGNLKAGQLRALAVTSARRSPAAPEIPTVAETAVPDFEAATWFALVAPAGTPRDVLARLNREVVRALAEPDVKQRFADLGMSSEDSTPDGVETYIRSEIAKWTRVIKDADIRALE